MAARFPGTSPGQAGSVTEKKCDSSDFIEIPIVTRWSDQMFSISVAPSEAAGVRTCCNFDGRLAARAGARTGTRRKWQVTAETAHARAGHDGDLDEFGAVALFLPLLHYLFHKYILRYLG